MVLILKFILSVFVLRENSRLVTHRWRSQVPCVKRNGSPSKSVNFGLGRDVYEGGTLHQSLHWFDARFSFEFMDIRPVLPQSHAKSCGLLGPVL